MDDSTKLVAILAAIALLPATPLWKNAVNNYKLSSIPTVGSSGLFTSYIGALRFFRKGPDMLREGYKKHRGAAFKVPMISRWLILVSGAQMVDDIRAAGDDQLSVHEALREAFHLDLILPLGTRIHEDRYHADVVKLPLTRNIGNSFSDVQDEIANAFSHHISTKGDEWVTIAAYPTMMDIVCRTTNRMLVGLPLCRNPDYVELNKTFTVTVVRTAEIINMFPSFLWPIVARLLPGVSRGIKCGIEQLEPLFRARLEQEEQYGKEWPERPNDAISWISDYSNKEMPTERRILDMILRVLLINSAAIATATMSFTYVLFDLASRPEYVQPMRDEIEDVIREEGWSKAAVTKLRKVDSFIKESLRTSSLNTVALQRKVMKNFTFSNGLTVPAGNTLAVPLVSIHSDPDNFPDAGSFDGFRFEKMRNEEGMANKHQVVSLDLNYLLFGHGHHAWQVRILSSYSAFTEASHSPGRFFAANELKLMLAYILMNYDVQMANGLARPAQRSLGLSMLPDTTAQVMFRKRV